MLGSLTEADDAVQDAWLRLNRADTREVDNLGGWLTTVVARLCLDMLRSRKARHEDSMGIHVPEPIIAGADATDPEQELLLADSVGLAMLVVLEKLTPAERLAFVLHDTFGLPFDEIAPIVGRSTTTTRQLASRARRRVRGATTSSDVDVARQREVVDAFLAAARAGDFEALLRVLDPDVVVRADAGAGRSLLGRTREVRGARAVAKQAFGFRRLADGARRALVNGAAGLVVFDGTQPFAVLGFTIRGKKIVEIDILADPARLKGLDLSSVE
jgi:RNA polymerase sigma-70 factor (ECF subfamily)